MEQGQKYGATPSRGFYDMIQTVAQNSRSEIWSVKSVFIPSNQCWFNEVMVLCSKHSRDTADIDTVGWAGWVFNLVRT